ncbi:MAG: TRAP transporter small permease [Peptoniphilus sp.]|uniref:TRAP transporter small permease n=1 Tax=Peptoniphilus sp. TaxID=1971214 RepID=UPI002A762E8F|nr:TRAP transporter small permease [Peptoniphilus sp.]MDY2987841.1 TRAP transporter small permease [Peptoniphilus sp.]
MKLSDGKRWGKPPLLTIEGEYMRKFFKTYNNIEERILVFSLILNVLVVSLQIIMRSVFNTSISWSEELSRYIFIWEIWLGTSIAYRYNEHIKVELIYSIFKSDRSKKIIDIFIKLIWLAFNMFLVYQGLKLLGSMADRNALSSGMRIPLVYVYGVLPLSSTIMCIRIILDILNLNSMEEDKLEEDRHGREQKNILKEGEK